MSARGRRIVVFTSPGDRPSTVECLEALVRALPEARFTVVIGGTPRSRRSWLRAKFRRIRREPLSYPIELFEQVAAALGRRGADALRGLLGSATSIRGPVDPPLPLERVAEIAPDRVDVLRFPRMHGPDCLEAVAALEPWLGIAIAAPILREKLFAIPELGTVNLHKSALPEFRGMPPGFWEMHDEAAGAGTPRVGRIQAGATVHWVDRGLDTGDLVHQERIDIPPYATPDGLALRLDELGERVLVAAILSIVAGEAERRPQGTATTPVRSRPAWLVRRRVTRRAWRRRRTTARGSGPVPALREAAKSAVLFGWTTLLGPLRRLRWRANGQAHAAVLLYHRVSDDFLDSVTVGVEQFRDQMRILRRRYDVVDLRTLLEQQDRPRRRPVVAVTFDDGYEDNHLAARILRREGIPCTFFVCTGIVGTDDRSFPHDAKKLGRRVPALAWSQVDSMARDGFDFGNHTVDHVDVASLPVDEALDQVRRATDELESRTRAAAGDRAAEAARWFAFPYGRPQNVTDEVRQGLGSIGIDVCLSAHGGVNPPDLDRLDVLRQGIDHNFSRLGFRAVLEGWRLR